MKTKKSALETISELKSKVEDLRKNGVISDEEYIIISLRFCDISDMDLKPTLKLKEIVKFYTEILEGKTDVKAFCEEYKKNKENIISSKDHVDKCRKMLSEASNNEEKKEAVIYILDNIIDIDNLRSLLTDDSLRPFVLSVREETRKSITERKMKKNDN
jgi:fructose-1,6-bisphosphatase